ncbi:MAG: hypothetical protein PF505_00750 [Vallitaleaceae bacterium]|jgi:Cu2+-exporting ATPase|nr:hypothetical protein [Vallitaleaceae bacterium]
MNKKDDNPKDKSMNHSNMDQVGMNKGHDDQRGHQNHHAMMVADFKKRFFFSLILIVPILVLSPMIQTFLGVNWRFAGDSYILFGLSTVLFFYGGKPFLSGAIDELKKKSPAMMMLIALAITVSYVYSSFTVFVLEGNDFFLGVGNTSSHNASRSLD